MKLRYPHRHRLAVCAFLLALGCEGPEVLPRSSLTGLDASISATISDEECLASVLPDGSDAADSLLISPRATLGVEELPTDLATLAERFGPPNLEDNGRYYTVWTFPTEGGSVVVRRVVGSVDDHQVLEVLARPTESAADTILNPSVLEALPQRCTDGSRRTSINLYDAEEELRWAIRLSGDSVEGMLWYPSRKTLTESQKKEIEEAWR